MADSVDRPPVISPVVPQVDSSLLRDSGTQELPQPLKKPLAPQMTSWVVIGAVALFLYGIGFTFMTASVAFHVWIADAIFAIATVMVLWRFLTWEDARQQDHNTRRRTFGITIVAAFILLLVLMGANHYLNPIQHGRASIVVNDGSKLPAAPPTSPDKKAATPSSALALKSRHKPAKPSPPTLRTSMAPPPIPPPRVANVRIASQEQIPSLDNNYGYCLKVVIQADETISPVAFGIRFSGELGSVILKNPNVTMMGLMNFADDQKHTWSFEWANPPLTPDSPIVFDFYSKESVKAVDLFPTEYRWP